MLNVNQVNWKSLRFIRAGIIPYFEVNKHRLYAFGLENGVAALSDFGGHREEFDVDLLHTAIREYSEESLNIFGHLSLESLRDCPVLFGPETVEILLRVEKLPSFYSQSFSSLVQNNLDHEVQSIVWLTREQIFRACDYPEITFAGTKILHMYNRIRETLSLNKRYL